MFALAWKIPWTEEPGGLQSMGSQSWTGLSDFTFTFHFHALEKETATHSSVLAWRISWTEELSGLQSIGSQRIGKDWAHMYTHKRCVRPLGAGLPCPRSPGERFFRRRSSCGVQYAEWPRVTREGGSGFPWLRELPRRWWRWKSELYEVRS